MPCRLAGGACEARLGLDLGADLRRRGGAVAATRGAVGGDVEVRLVVVAQAQKTRFKLKALLSLATIKV